MVELRGRSDGRERAGQQTDAAIQGRVRTGIPAPGARVMESRTDYTLALAEWAASLTIDAIPGSVRDHAKLCLLDGLACGLYGSRLEWGRIAADVAVEM